MANDAYVAFLVGMLAGVVIGIAVSGIMAAISNNIERQAKDNDD